MPINFIGEPKHPIKKIQATTEIEMHMPEKERKRLEKAKKKAAKKEAKKKAVEAQKAVFGEVNFIKSFKIYILKRRLTFTILFVIIIIVVGGGLYAYFSFFYKPQPQIAQNINQPIAVNLPIVNLPPLPPSAYCGDNICNNNETCSTCSNDCGSCPLPPPPPLSAYCGDGICNNGELCSSCPVDCGSCPPPTPLPDTELAPLRGALVRFTGDINIYLVELNGELRQVETQSVYFANGQKISQTSPAKIYYIADRFRETRRGKDVIGFVEWDPRILSSAELGSFLR